MPASENSNQGNVWKLILSYDGTDFHGWQTQPGRPTIQGLLADAVDCVVGERVLPQGSGRTDAGVHARGQVATFSLRAAIPAENLRCALNRVLPAAIRILSAEHAPENFHARHNAVGKVYQYSIFPGEICSPFLARYVTCCRWPLDLEAMQMAAELVVGKHDFTSFAAFDPDRSARTADEEVCSSDADAENFRSPLGSNIRRIEWSQWTRGFFLPFPDPLAKLPIGLEADFYGDAAGGNGEEMLTYTVQGNGFLHHMVRNLVGTFIEVGRGRMKAAEMPRIIESRNRAMAGPTAAARGLCLMKVLY